MEMDSNINWPGWETVRLIGRGSFGAVYEIQRDMLGEKEKAALKVITIPQNSSDIEELYGEGYDSDSITSTFRDYLKSILAEYSLMRRLNGNTNVVNCDDVRYIQHDDGIGWDIFIKMELLTPLSKALGKEIPEGQVIRVGTDVCRALVLCKKHNIIHRDIKPANIFVSENGDYKLGDFGVAKTVEKTSGGTKIGTYEYMAPEVYHDEPYGSTADVYSLGMVLYWLLNERRTPFLKLPPELPTTSEKEEARRRRFGGEPLPAPAHGSEELKRIVLKACAYDPKDRYQSAEEMLDDLRSLGSGDAPLSVPAAAEDETTVGAFHTAARSDEMVYAVRTEQVSDFPETDTTVGAFAGNRSTLTGAAPRKSDPQRAEVKQKSSRKCLIVGGIAAALVLVAVLVLVLLPKNSRSSQNHAGKASTAAVEKPSVQTATPTATPAAEETAPAEDLKTTQVVPNEERREDVRVALITDSGSIDDLAFNQTAYEACSAFCSANDVDFTYFRPTVDSDAERTNCILKAIDQGYDVLILPGYLFAPSVAATAPEYPSVTFVLLDISEFDLSFAGLETLPDNVYSALYQEELCGFMAGYAAVKLGYKNLGFLGGMAAPAVIRCGYGFVQGADTAAAELGLADVTINYAYANQFYGDDYITTAMQDWFSSHTEVVFVVGGGLFTSVAEAADQFACKVIGMDYDQAAIIDSSYGKGITLTSAMKGYEVTIEDQIAAVMTGNFVGGRVEILGIVSEDPEKNYVQLAPSTQFGTGFTYADYKALVAKLLSGTYEVNADVSAQPEAYAKTVAVVYWGSLK